MIVVATVVSALLTGTTPNPQAVVQAFYKHIIATKPLGIPSGNDRKALSPMMAPRLLRILDDAMACERDYFRTHRNPNDKPNYWWLEEGIFSGGNEEGIPADVAIVKSIRTAPGNYRVIVEFTYRESFETYGRPPDPSAHFSWRGAVAVDCSKGARCLIDDYTNLDPEANPRGRPLSRLSAHRVVEGNG